MFLKQITSFHTILLLIISSFLLAQENAIEVNAEVDIITKQIRISQTIKYTNSSSDVLNEIYLHDWNHSYSSRKTPLAERFSEEFSTKFLFADEEEYGFTKVFNIKQDNQNLNFDRLKKQQDVIKVLLQKPLNPGESYTITLDYITKLPSDTFTRYGVTDADEFHLKYWYISPAVYDGSWQYYSNKDLDDLFIPKSTITLHVAIPLNYRLTTELDFVNRSENNNTQTITVSGKNRITSKLYLKKLPVFKTVQTDYFNIISDITEKSLKAQDRAIINDKIAGFITEHIGDYPHKNMLITSVDDRKDPVYGLNQLPSFIRPFPSHFQYELKIVKAAIGSYLDNTLFFNPRKDYWLRDALQVYFLMIYIDVNYPDMKLFGSFAKAWGIRSFHAADLKFNDQYGLAYMHMARTNRDQAISKQKDSLLKFNTIIGSKYKAGAGLTYLDAYINGNIVEESIKEFLEQKKLSTITSKDFQSFIKSKTTKNIDWFFDEFVNSRSKIDYKIKDIVKTDDSITLTIKNKQKSAMPISLFSLKNDSVVDKQWIENVTDEKTITIPRDSTDKLVLNFDGKIPEFNLRDNWKSLSGWFLSNKPLQFRIFQDFEDPNYNQVFFMPLVQFKNIYDGLTLGARIYNKTVLRKPFIYSFSPQYATKSKSITGSASMFHRINIEGRDLYEISYGGRFAYGSYAEDLFFRNISPSVQFKFRDNSDFRSNKRQALNFRFIDITRDEDVNNILDQDDVEPNYSVFNARFVHSNLNLEVLTSWFADFQFGNNFSKLSLNYKYRKLLNKNQQFSIRLFGGLFLHNDTPRDSDYFSFALDRPTDYLFDYNYLGRSEDSGLFSQQLIIAEGGFKSMLDPAFANQWMTTANMSLSIWRYIQLYGDLGLVKNKNQNAEFVYDSGIRLNLVQDYFEIYFPLYSNLGWEIRQPNYDERIRFIFTVDPKSLFGLFRRKWF